MLQVEIGDLFICLPLQVGSIEGDPLPADLALAAVQKGAVAVIAEDDEVAEQLPPDFPLVLVSDVEEVQVLPPSRCCRCHHCLLRAPCRCCLRPL